MEYLHMQKPCPSEVKGVSVDLYAIYPDGSCNLVGTAVTEPLAGGIFNFAWVPPGEGVYTIMAIFNGDESYGSSFAGTSLLVVSPTGPVTATAEQAEFTQILVAALIVIVVVCLCLVAYVIYINRKMLKQAAK
jgi:hypothetical protein